MKRMLASVPVDPHGSALKRANIVRALAEALSTEAPSDDLWTRCSSLLCDLMGGKSAVIAIRNEDQARIAHAFRGGAGSVPLDSTVPRGSAIE